MAAVVLDASVVIGALDATDSHYPSARAAITARRLAGDDLRVPASVWSEVLVGAFRQGRASEAERQVRVFAGAPRPVDREVAVATARLRALHPALRLPDALVLATAEVDDADVLTADRRWSAYSARVTVLG